MMSAEHRSANMPSLAASRALLPEGLVAIVFQLVLWFRGSSSDRVVTSVQFTLDDRHSIIRFVRAELAWFQGGRASSPTKHTSKLHCSPSRCDPRYQSPHIPLNRLW